MLYFIIIIYMLMAIISTAAWMLFYRVGCEELEISYISESLITTTVTFVVLGILWPTSVLFYIIYNIRSHV